MPYPSPPLFPSSDLLPGGVLLDARTFTEQVEASLAPWNDLNGVWQALNAALAAPVEQVFAIVADQGSPDDPANYLAGWSILLDPDNCPVSFIPFGAQFVGVQIPPGTPEAEARAIWKNEAGFTRGGPAAMTSAAQRFLTGSHSVVLLERTPDPYAVMMVIRPEQVVDRVALENAVLAVKPAGIVVTFVYTDGWTIFQMEASQATITALEAAFTSINGIEQDQVGH